MRNLMCNLFRGSSLVLMCLAAFCLSACMSVQVSENQFIHPDSRSGYRLAEKLDAASVQQMAANAELTEWRLDSSDGVTLQGIRIQLKQAQVSVLYFGGNMFHLDDGAKYLLPAMQQCGVNLLSFDYRGYGRSSGQPNVANMQADALRIYDYARAQTTGKLIVHGQSLGSFIAGYVAQHRQLDGLVLESTASNAMDWALANMPWYAKAFVTIELSPALQDIDNTRAVAGFRGKSLVLVGDQDQITPLALGRKVYDALPSADKRFMVSSGGGHNGLMRRTDMVDAYCGFVRSI
ncbi:alpha/beta hydrolase [Undibacterium sp. Ji50W]|uniref:alpha/beta hydrolase n=1 Tax=Undibacterium sp. Ji50W TaxID=3413041 RepID=UPI003BF0C659